MLERSTTYAVFGTEVSQFGTEVSHRLCGKSLKRLESCRYRSITPEGTNSQGFSTDLWINIKPRLRG
jgi:hypothetical protein